MMQLFKKIRGLVSKITSSIKGAFAPDPLPSFLNALKEHDFDVAFQALQNEKLRRQIRDYQAQNPLTPWPQTSKWRIINWSYAFINVFIHATNFIAGAINSITSRFRSENHAELAQNFIKLYLQQHSTNSEAQNFVLLNRDDAAMILKGLININKRSGTTPPLTNYVCDEAANTYMRIFDSLWQSFRKIGKNSSTNIRNNLLDILNLSIALAADSDLLIMDILLILTKEKDLAGEIITANENTIIQELLNSMQYFRAYNPERYKRQKYSLNNLLKFKAVETSLTQAIVKDYTLLRSACAIRNIKILELALADPNVITALAQNLPDSNEVLIQILQTAVRFDRLTIVEKLLADPQILAWAKASSDLIVVAPANFAYADDTMWDHEGHYGHPLNKFYNANAFLRLMQLPNVFANTARHVSQETHGFAPHRSIREMRSRAFFADKKHWSQTTQDIYAEGNDLHVLSLLNEDKSALKDIMNMYIQHLLVKIEDHGAPDFDNDAELVQIYYEVIRYLSVNREYFLEPGTQGYLPPTYRDADLSSIPLISLTIFKLLDSSWELSKYFVIKEHELLTRGSTDSIVKNIPLNTGNIVPYPTIVVGMIIIEPMPESEALASRLENIIHSRIQILIKPIEVYTKRVEFMDSFNFDVLEAALTALNQPTTQTMGATVAHPESSMRGFNAGELNVLKLARQRYRSTILEATTASSPFATEEVQFESGLQNILQELRNYIISLYTQQPAQYKHENLPLEWNDLLTLRTHKGWNEAEFTSVLKEYYQSIWHSAYRYLLMDNPWLGKDPEDKHILHTSAEPPKLASASFLNNQHLLAICFLEASNPDAVSKNSLDSIDERKQNIVKVLAQLQRAGNLQQISDRRTGVSTEKDDLKFDNPSCVPGTPRPMIERVHTEAFVVYTADHVNSDMQKFVHAYFAAAFNDMEFENSDESILTLKQIYNLLFNAGHEHNIFINFAIDSDNVEHLVKQLSNLNIPKEAKQEFLQSMIASYIKTPYLNCAQILKPFLEPNLDDYFGSEFIYFMKSCSLQSLFMGIYNVKAQAAQQASAVHAERVTRKEQPRM